MLRIFVYMLCIIIEIFPEYSSLISATHVQVIQENSKEFLQCMHAKALTATLFAQGVIPFNVKNYIDHSKSRVEANGHLLSYLSRHAPEEQVQAFTVASEVSGYAKMNEFAASILHKLQQGTHLSTYKCGL